MHATPAVERHARDVARGRARCQGDGACDVPVWPVGEVADRRWHGVVANGKSVQAAPAVEDVATGAVAQERDAFGDVPVRPVAGAPGRERAAEGMEAAPAVEDVPLGPRARRARQERYVTRDVEA